MRFAKHADVVHSTADRIPSSHASSSAWRAAAFGIHACEQNAFFGHSVQIRSLQASNFLNGRNSNIAKGRVVPHDVKGDFLEGGVRVPAQAWWPGTIEPGQLVGDIIHETDLYTTFARVASTAGKKDRRHSPTRDGSSHRIRLAGECARIGKRHRAGDDPVVGNNTSCT